MPGISTSGPYPGIPPGNRGPGRAKASMLPVKANPNPAAAPVSRVRRVTEESMSCSFADGPGPACPRHGGLGVQLTNLLLSYGHRKKEFGLRP